MCGRQPSGRSREWVNLAAEREGEREETESEPGIWGTLKAVEAGSGPSQTL